jgi:hypothetical protein
MDRIFKIIKSPEKEGEAKEAFSIGIDVHIAGQDVPCPISKACLTQDDLVSEINKIREDLEVLKEDSWNLFEKEKMVKELEITPEMDPQQVWNRLCKIESEDRFVNIFNGLDDDRRKAIAEHVLTNCNVFSGKGAVFSARYNNETGFME